MTKIDKITTMVIEYKETRSNKLMIEIIKQTEKLIYSVYKYYGVNNFPAIEQDEITADCKSLVLLKSIEDFRADKNAKFTTFYVWRLKSHIRAKKESYMSRLNIRQTIPFDTKDENFSDYSYAETLTKWSNLSMLSRVKQLMKSKDLLVTLMEADKVRV